MPTSGRRRWDWPSLRMPLAVSVSLAGQLLIETWVMVEQVRSPQSLYLSFSKPWPVLELSALINMAVFTVAFFLLITVTERVRNRLNSDALYVPVTVLAGLISWNFLRWLTLDVGNRVDDVFFGGLSLGMWLWRAGFLLSLVATPVALYSLVLKPGKVWCFFQTISLVLLPFALYRVATTAWQAAFQPGRDVVFTTKTQHAPAETVGRKRLVLWLIFDEMDYRATFESETAAWTSKSLRDLRNYSFHATRAFEPSDGTARAVPGYLVGRPVAHVRWDSPDDLMLQFVGDDKYNPWTAQQTLLHEAAGLHRTTAVLGYYHPYCRLFGGQVSECEVLPDPERGELQKWWSTLLSVPLYRAAFMQASLSLPLPRTEVRYDGVKFRAWTTWVQDHVTKRHTECASQARNSLLQMVSDRKLDFVVAHLPFPHPPGLRHYPEPDGTAIDDPGYSDNLLAADHLLGETIALLRSMGRWDETTLIVTSDHSVRDFWLKHEFLDPSLREAIEKRREPTVPLLVKLPHQTEGMQFEKPFNAVLVHGIVRAALRGELTSPEQIAEYLDKNRTRFPLVTVKSGEASGF
ncbi:MAG: alkaline phosphatase family protein [Bryobacteraceae bacterium]